MSGRVDGRSVWVVGTCALLVVGAMVVAGPISPPNGAIAPTGRTLEEVYNKIPNVGGADGRIPIAGGTSIVTISQPGNYVLTGNISITTANSNGLVIDASDVSLDMNGFTISSTTATGAGVLVNSGRDRAVVRNGTVVGFSSSVTVTAGASDALIENVRGKGCKLVAFFMGGARGSARRCDALLPGAGTTAADTLTNQLIGGFTVTGTGVEIEDCTVRDFAYNGSGTSLFRGVNVNASGTGAMVRGCVISNATAITGTGVVFVGATTGVYRDNTTINMSAGASGGINGGGNVP